MLHDKRTQMNVHLCTKCFRLGLCTLHSVAHALTPSIRCIPCMIMKHVMFSLYEYECCMFLSVCLSAIWSLIFTCVLNRITRTFCLSNRGHGLYLTSPSELQKFTLCADFWLVNNTFFLYSFYLLSE